MASKKRLIDANALSDLLDVEYKRKMKLVRKGENHLDTLAEGIMSVSILLGTMPTVDAVEVADMKEFAEDVVYQFGYYGQSGGRLCITHGGLSTLEWAFDILGWENPHPVPEFECEIDGCHEHATCGVPTADGYKRMCSKHCLGVRANE